MTSHCKKKKTKCLASDIISNLPQNIIENILTSTPIRDAIRTSILSRNWRSCWKGMPKLEFYDKELVQVPSDCEELEKYKFLKIIFHVMLLHRDPILEFNLYCCFLECEMDYEFDPVMCYLSRSNTVKKIKLLMPNNSNYKLPSSFFSLQGLEILELYDCDFNPPLTFNGFSRLKSVVFVDVKITSNVLQRFLSKCPILKEMRLSGSGCVKDHRNIFSFVELLQSVPSLTTLYISPWYMMCLGADGMPQKLPTSPFNLRCLSIYVCLTEPADILAVLCLMRSSPNLEKLDVMIYEILGARELSMNLTDFQDFSSFNLNRLQEVKISNFRNVAPGLEFVKLIMAKSPVLKKMQISPLVRALGLSQ